MKKFFALLILICLVFAALLGVSPAVREPRGEILAIYSCPDAQIVTGADQTKELADTVIFLYRNMSYVQYIIHDGEYEIYSEGGFTADFDWNEPDWQYDAPHIITVNVEKLHRENHRLTRADLTYDINLDWVTNYCLYPDDARPDLKLTAAFIQTDKQLLVHTDGSEEYLPTMWFYFDDGTFRQYALFDGREDRLFSRGEYSITGGGFADAGAVLTIHRTQKYKDGVGLADYDSLHDYVIGELDFIRIYPAA